MKRRVNTALWLLALFCVCARPAAAQISRLGETFLVGQFAVRGVTTAYDPRNGVYLVVSGAGPLYGRFVSADGAPLASPFLIQSVVNYGHFPHVESSPDAYGGNGAFLVVWNESDAAVPSVHARLVSYTAGFLSADTRISPNDSFWEVHGAPVLYSTVSRQFLVIYRTFQGAGGGDIVGVRVDLNGQPVGGPFGIAGTGSWEGNPSFAYNPALDEYLVVYSSGSAAVGQRVKGGTGALIGGPIVYGAGGGVLHDGRELQRLDRSIPRRMVADPARCDLRPSRGRRRDAGRQRDSDVHSIWHLRFARRRPQCELRHLSPRRPGQGQCRGRRDRAQ